MAKIFAVIDYQPEPMPVSVYTNDNRPAKAMDYRTQSNGSQHLCGVLLVCTPDHRDAPCYLDSFDFFTELNGLPWISLFHAAFTLLILGGSLIVYAKLPVYHSGRFFTFGIKSVPAHLTGYYRWGWRVFLFGAHAVTVFVVVESMRCWNPSPKPAAINIPGRSLTSSCTTIPRLVLTK